MATQAGTATARYGRVVSRSGSCVCVSIGGKSPVLMGISAYLGRREGEVLAAIGERF